MGEIVMSDPDPRQTIQVGKLESEYKVIVGEEDAPLAAASKRETGEFNRAKVAAAMEKRRAARVAAEVEREVLNYLDGDDCPTPVCVPKFDPDPAGFDDMEDTPVEIPRPRGFLDPEND